MEHEFSDPTLAAAGPSTEPEASSDSAQREADRRFMAEALQLAGQVARRPWPNPPVGAVVVQQGKVVGRGAHEGAGTLHAEIHALAAAGEAARGATLYCSLEPCNHTGRTPPCAEAILNHGVARVVAAVRDPNPGVTGGGLRRLAEQGVSTTVGVQGRQACELIWPFVVTRAFARPYVMLKTAVTLDGRFTPGTVPPESIGPLYLTGNEARRDVHRQRRWMDLVLVGEETLRRDRPRLDGRLVSGSKDCPGQDPLPGYVDSDLSWAEAWNQKRYLLFTARDHGRPEVMARLTAAGAQVIPCTTSAGHVDPQSLCEEAHRHGVQTMMVEGGPTLAAAFLTAGVVDRWVQYVAPRYAGAGVQWPTEFSGRNRAEFQLTSCTKMGADLRLSYDRLSFSDQVARLTRPQSAPAAEEGGDQCSPA